MIEGGMKFAVNLKQLTNQAVNFLERESLKHRIFIHVVKECQSIQTEKKNSLINIKQK